MARVAEVGEAVSSVTPGDLVVVPFQISCGTCRACQAGRTGNCESVALGSMYGYEPFGGPWGGFLADKVRVPYADAMLVRLSPAIDPAAVASLSDNVADAWRTVGPPLAEAPGSEVLIVGGAGGSVPLYAIQLALALGAPIVHYLDTDQRALALAAQLGAQASEVRKGSFPRRLGPFAITVDASMNTVDAGQAEPVADGSPYRSNSAIAAVTPGIGSPSAITCEMTRSVIRSATSASVSSAPLTSRLREPAGGSRSRQAGISSSIGRPVESSRSLSLRQTPSLAKTADVAARQAGSVSMSRPSMSRITASTGGRVNAGRRARRGPGGRCPRTGGPGRSRRDSR